MGRTALSRQGGISLAVFDIARTAGVYRRLVEISGALCSAPDHFGVCRNCLRGGWAFQEVSASDGTHSFTRIYADACGIFPAHGFPCTSLPVSGCERHSRAATFG